MKLRAAVTEMAGDRTASELSETVGKGDGGLGGGTMPGQEPKLLEHQDPPSPAEAEVLTRQIFRAAA